MEDREILQRIGQLVDDEHELCQRAVLAVPVGERDHIRGPAHAPITLVEYGDYECPYCSTAYPVVKELGRRLGSRMLMNIPSWSNGPSRNPGGRRDDQRAVPDPRHRGQPSARLL